MHPALPVEGVSVILWNNLAQEHVWQNHSTSVVTASQLKESDAITEQFPNVFTAFAVTASHAVAEVEQLKVVAEKTRFATRFALPDFPLPLSCNKLVKEQHADQSLSSLVGPVVSTDTFESIACGYTFQNGLLV